MSTYLVSFIIRRGAEDIIHDVPVRAAGAASAQFLAKNILRTQLGRLPRIESVSVTANT